MTDPQVGDLLGGKYEVEGILGRGGMGVVVAARHRELGQKVAIKCLLSQALAIRDVVERFAREARAAVQIQGEHVARVIDVGRFDDGTPYMVMEYLKGHDLSDELTRRGPLPVTDAVRYLLEASEAIAQAHALRIVHRDLKPANLFLAETPGRRPIIKVLDFGISKIVEPNADALTKTASVMGTPFYMSPEQLLSAKNVDERTDIWALGVILYELLSGRPPFVGESVPEIVAQILQNAPQPLRAVRPDVSPALEAVIARCMQSKAGDRYANVAGLASALSEHADAADRESAVAIARVLGHTPPPPVATAPDRTVITTPGASTSPSGHPAATASTAHNLAVSAPGAPSTSSRLPLVIGGVAVVAILGLGGVIAFRSSGAKASAGVTAPDTATAATIAATASAPPSPAPSAPPAALAPLPTIESATPGAANSAPTPGPAGPTNRGPRTTTPTPHPSTAPATPPPPTPTSGPKPAPTPETPRNPLDLQLKK
jgi:serine/threonine-protein kinase